MLRGPAFWKAPAIEFPAYSEDEPYVIDARSYDETTYNQWNLLWSSAGSSAAQVDSAFGGFTPAFNGSYAPCFQAHLPMTWPHLHRGYVPQV